MPEIGVAATVIGLLASPFDKIVGLSATALQNMLQHDDSRNSLVEMGVLVALVNAAEVPEYMLILLSQ